MTLNSVDGGITSDTPNGTELSYLTNLRPDIEHNTGVHYQIFDVVEFGTAPAAGMNFFYKVKVRNIV